MRTATWRDVRYWLKADISHGKRTTLSRSPRHNLSWARCRIVEAITITSSNSARVDNIDDCSNFRASDICSDAHASGTDRHAHCTYRQCCRRFVEIGAIGAACDVAQTATATT